MAQQNGGDEQRLYSSKASHALSLPEQGTARAPAPTGRPLAPQGASTFNIDDLQPGESQPELQVMPITMLRTDYKLEHSQQIAVNSNYICYGLKAGQVRVLNKHSASRSLFKGHSPVPLADMAFFSLDSNLLATASRAGDVFVRLIREPGTDGPHSAVLMRAKLPAGSDQALPKLAWHPAMPQILAGASGSRVCLFMVPSEQEAGPDDDNAETAPPDTLPGIEFGLLDGALATALAFSPAGDLLAAADSSGRISVWRLEGNADDSEPPQAPLLVFHPYANAERDAAPGSIIFLGQQALLTGDAANRTLKLWLLPDKLDDGSPALLQTVSFASARGAEDFFNHLVLQPRLGFVVLANSARQQVYVLHYSGSGDEDSMAVLDYLASFLVKQSILSVTTMVEAAEAFANGSSSISSMDSLLLYCVQTDAIQQYTVNAALCRPSSDMLAAQAAPEQAQAAAAAALEPEAAAAPPAAQRPAPVAPKQQQPEVSAPVPAPVVDLQAPAGPAAEEEAAEAAAATAAAADGNVELPEIPGPPEAPELPVVQPHGLQELLLAAHPPAPTPTAAEAAETTRLPPVSTGQPAVAAAAVADGGAEVPLPQTLPSPMRLLRPNELREAAMRPLPPGHSGLESAGSNASSEVNDRGSVLARAAEASRATAAAALKEAGEKGRNAESPEPAAAAAAKAHALDLEEGEIAAGESAQEAVEAPEAPAAVPEAAAPAPAPAPEAADGEGVGVSEPAAAVADGPGVGALQPATTAASTSSEELAAIRHELAQLVTMQQKLAAQMLVSHKDVVSGVKGALRTTENTLGQRFESVVKANAKRSDEERKKAAAAERKELEKALGQQVVQASAGVVRDLSKALQESSERQSRAVVAATTAALTPLLNTALRTALTEAGAPNGALSGAVERALGAQLQGALEGPVGEALRETFSVTVLPAFERATQVMFGQIEAAFTAWMQDQGRASSSANAEVATSLAASASELTGLVSTMRTEVLEGQRALSRMASSTSMGAPSERSVQSAQVPEDPKAAIRALVAARDYEAAFGRALGLADIPTLMWLCRQVDSSLVTGDPSPLSQVVLLSLVQQLAADLTTDAELKLDWLTNVAPCVQPGDPQVAPHLKGVLGGVMANLKSLMGRLSSSAPVAKKGKVAAHLVNSLLHQ